MLYRVILLLFLSLLMLVSGCGAVAEYAASSQAEKILNIGIQALYNGNETAAAKYFSHAAELRPSGDIFGRIGLAYFTQGQYEESLPWLEKAMQSGIEQPWSVKVALAGAYESTGQEGEAARLISQALGAMPDDPAILNEVAYPLADSGILLDEIIIILQQAVAKAPKNGMIIDSLGWAYYQRGDYGIAYDLLRRAKQLSPNDGVIIFHFEQARQMLEQIESEKPGVPKR